MLRSRRRSILRPRGSSFKRVGTFNGVKVGCKVEQTVVVIDVYISSLQAMAVYTCS